MEFLVIFLNLFISLEEIKMYLFIVIIRFNWIFPPIGCHSSSAPSLPPPRRFWLCPRGLQRIPSISSIFNLGLFLDWSAASFGCSKATIFFFTSFYIQPTLILFPLLSTLIGNFIIFSLEKWRNQGPTIIRKILTTPSNISKCRIKKKKNDCPEGHR